MNSDGMTVVRTPLPREFDQVHGERRRMVNPALDVYSRAPLVMPAVCCVSHCGREATQGAFCDDCFSTYETYNRIWATEDARRADVSRQARKAAGWRFFNGFVFFASVELLVGYCIESPLIWQTFALGVGCALVAGLGNAIVGGKAGAA
jgi:hypothetical protein